MHARRRNALRLTRLAHPQHPNALQTRWSWPHRPSDRHSRFFRGTRVTLPRRPTRTGRAAGADLETVDVSGSVRPAATCHGTSVFGTPPHPILVSETHDACDEWLTVPCTPTHARRNWKPKRVLHVRGVQERSAERPAIADHLDLADRTDTHHGCRLPVDMSGGTRAQPLGRPLDGEVRRHRPPLRRAARWQQTRTSPMSTPPWIAVCLRRGCARARV
jgi:hypothetical protein